MALCWSALLLTVAAGVRAQEKHEIGLVIGSAVTPDQSFSSGSASSVSFRSSLALGAEYDYRLGGSDRMALYGGMDFLA